MQTSFKQKGGPMGIYNTLSVDESNGAWRVIATGREHPYGWAIPVLIRNMAYHYTHIVVLGDGVVDCWERLDMILFREKLKNGWVATSAPLGAMFSVFGLGAATVEAFEPNFKPTDVELRVMDAIRFWNPELKDLVDLDGCATEPHGKLLRAKIPNIESTHFREAEDQLVMLAKSVSVFVKASETIRLTRWFVYADGTSRLGPDGELVETGAVEDRVLREEVVLSIPDGSWVDIDGLGRAKMSQGRWLVDPIDCIREQQGHLAELRGASSLVDACKNAWRAYVEKPGERELEVLRQRYRDVPNHLRPYCGDMDTKDANIRRALRGGKSNN